MPEMLIEQSRRIVQRGGPLIAVMMVAALMLAACGGESGDSGAQIDWKPGTPPVPAMAAVTPATGDAAAAAPTATVITSESTASEAQAPASPDTGASETTAPTSGAAPTTADGQRAAALTPTQLKQLQPNELGQIPILEYHNFTTDPDQEAQFTRTYKDFKSDLQWLYDHDFYVIPLHDLFRDQISAPAGKHPVALTFDDSTVGQLRFLAQDDGSFKVDPDSAVGVMEAFYAEHPDFGRGGFFAVLPQSCFDWQGTEVEQDQVPLCEQKLKWLLDNGYEVSSHTLNHQDLADVTDATFKKEIGGGIQALQKMVPQVTGDILALPDGSYPDGGDNETQMDMMRNGFDYNGEQFKLAGCLMVGADPANSPVSTDWDPIWTPRIQAFNAVDEYGSTAFWFAAFENNPARLYTSDGNPDTITMPDVLPPMLDGTFDPNKAAAGNKQVIRYNASTGAIG